jgi:DNA-binding NtrC family response regulator
LKGFTDDARDIMLKYHWPGNIRELEHKIEQAVIMSESEYISSKDLDLSVVDKQTKASVEEKEHLIPYTSKQYTEASGINEDSVNNKFKQDNQFEDKESLLQEKLKSILKNTVENYIDSTNDADLNLHHNLKKDLIEEIEKKTLSFVLTKASGNKSQAGKLLGIDFKTICRKLKKYQNTIGNSQLAVGSNQIDIGVIIECINEIIENRIGNIDAIYNDIFELVKNYVIDFVIYKTSNNLTKASQLLGITRNTLRKVKRKSFLASSIF